MNPTNRRRALPAAPTTTMADEHKSDAKPKLEKQDSKKGVKYVKPGDSQIKIEPIHGVPAISMVWNPDMARHLHVDKVRRWFVDGETRLWTKQELADFTHLCCISHHAPAQPGAPANFDHAAALADFWVFVTNLDVQLGGLRREALLHQQSLAFCQERAKKNRWILPGNLEKKYGKQVAILLGDAPPPARHHHHHHHHKSSKEAKDHG